MRRPAVIEAIENVDEVALEPGYLLSATEPINPPPFFSERDPPEVWVVPAREPPGLGLRLATALASRALAVQRKG
jgi:hypothetical protein